jgi:hypothetical protein
MSEPTAEWTIMIFLNGDNNLEPFGLQDFREMARVGSTAQVNIVVQFDRSGAWGTTTPQWEQTLRFRVEKHMEPLPAQAVEDIGEANMGDGRVLADFVSWARQRYPAHRHLLVIWNHGQGWRVFDTTPVRGRASALTAHRAFRTRLRTREAMRRATRLARSREAGMERATETLAQPPAIPLHQVVGGAVRYVSTDDTDGDQLYNREIQDSLLELLQGEHLDLIGFDACLMSMVETGYALRGVARVLVGSEELEPGAGWNYTDWLQVVVDNPAIDAAELGKVLVESYQRTYEELDPTVTLSAVDLSAMDQLATAIDALSDELIQKLDQELPNIQQARSNCEAYAPGYGLHGIDLGRFCEQLRLTTADAALQATADDVFSVVQGCVLTNYAGPDRQDAFGSYGLAIYFPENRGLFETDADHEGYLKTNTHFPVEFVQAHRWADFLAAYYQRV